MNTMGIQKYLKVNVVSPLIAEVLYICDYFIKLHLFVLLHKTPELLYYFQFMNPGSITNLFWRNSNQYPHVLLFCIVYACSVFWRKLDAMDQLQYCTMVQIHCVKFFVNREIYRKIENVKNR